MTSLPWPAANALLLEVREPGAPDAYGDVSDANEAAATVVWSGSIEAALKRERVAHKVGDAMTTVEVDVLVVRKPPADLAALTPGDAQSAHTVLVEDHRAPAPYPKVRWHIVDVANRARGAESDSLRLVLRDPRPVA